jgi:hypothetical protein
MTAVRAAGFVILAESPVLVVLGRANRSLTVRRLPSLDERTLSGVLRGLGLPTQTFLSWLPRDAPSPSAADPGVLKVIGHVPAKKLTA